jgi:hypothetical protein
VYTLAAIQEDYPHIDIRNLSAAIDEAIETLRSCCKIPHANQFSNSRIMLIRIIAALLTVNLSGIIPLLETV